jgi:hypothetical protein
MWNKQLCNKKAMQQVIIKLINVLTIVNKHEKEVSGTQFVQITLRAT